MTTRRNRAAAVSAAVNRAGDVGLVDLATELEKAVAPYHRRRTAMELLRAARVVRIAAEHFNARPIVEHAVALEKAANDCVAAVDAEIAANFSERAARGMIDADQFSIAAWREARRAAGHATPEVKGACLPGCPHDSPHGQPCRACIEDWQAYRRELAEGMAAE